MLKIGGSKYCRKFKNNTILILLSTVLWVHAVDNFYYSYLSKARTVPPRTQWTTVPRRTQSRPSTTSTGLKEIIVYNSTTIGVHTHLNWAPWSFEYHWQLQNLVWTWFMLNLSQNESSDQNFGYRIYTKM